MHLTPHFHLPTQSFHPVIHWPVAFQPGNGLFPPDPKDPKNYVALDLETSLVDTWKALIALPKSKVRAIGVSNFSVKTLGHLLEHAKVVPVTNQVEVHPCHPQFKLEQFCRERGILITAYSPLGIHNIFHWKSKR